MLAAGASGWPLCVALPASISNLGWHAGTRLLARLKSEASGGAFGCRLAARAAGVVVGVFVLALFVLAAFGIAGGGAGFAGGRVEVVGGVGDPVAWS